MKNRQREMLKKGYRLIMNDYIEWDSVNDTFRISTVASNQMCRHFECVVVSYVSSFRMS